MPFVVSAADLQILQIYGQQKKSMLDQLQSSSSILDTRFQNKQLMHN